MAIMAIRQVVNIVHPSNAKISASAFSKPKSPTFIINNSSNIVQFINSAKLWGKHCPIAFSKASSADSISTTDSDEDGVSLGTMKLPSDTDVARFETLLFQWGNSLCQGANLPLPVPLKVDKIPNGARLGFITVGDGDTEVLVYIDCLVFPGSENSTPMFRAIRNGPKKDQPPPGEPRIMRSLLDALRKCVEIARI
ncbi:hypothetical protein PHJA_002631700 [Phtheirospermum japonicum]|uniref:DUF7148 domain-containing protein n=1 Tax=Phtheirospermum japonicum TaxID=374723 RepID=A0A830DD27_9LAMI|nr:hypothetical protein PHJA_002631700 [Phtheirospermum japonicum]